MTHSIPELRGLLEKAKHGRHLWDACRVGEQAIEALTAAEERVEKACEVLRAMVDGTCMDRDDWQFWQEQAATVLAGGT